MTWLDEANAAIARVHASLPADATLEDRKKALQAARPYFFSCTSWGRKVWPKATRKYLERYGLPPRQSPQAPDLLSPLDRAKAEYERRQA